MEAYTYEDAEKVVYTLIETRATYCDECARIKGVPVMGKYGGFEKTILLMKKATAEYDGKPLIITDEYMNEICERLQMYQKLLTMLREDERKGMNYDKCGN